MRVNTKAVVTEDRLGDHWGTGAFWELAVTIYVQHLQVCFKSGGTVEKRQVLVCHTYYGTKVSMTCALACICSATDIGGALLALALALR